MTIDRLKLKYFINGELIFIQVMELFSFEIFSGKICGIPSFFFENEMNEGSTKYERLYLFNEFSNLYITCNIHNIMF